MSSRVFLLAFLFACSSSEGDGSNDCLDGLTRCGSACVDLEVDSEHCGACDTACGEGQVCEFGSCTDESCPDGREMCDGRCVNTKNNIRHCGGCNLACADDEVCLDGVCSPSCAPGEEACDGACVDLQSDASHCGACGNACPDGGLCSRGKCSETCDEGLTACGAGCVDIQSDRRNCGGCNFACDAGLECVEGFCSCPPGQSECDGACIDVSSDPENCGGCGVLCPATGLPHASSAQCGDSICNLECNPGRGDCNGVATDGCETDLGSDPSHCGGCGIDCEAGPHVVGARCTGGGCMITVCEHGWWDVNGDHEDGCEVNTLSHPEHCGVGGGQSTLVDCTRIPYADVGLCNDGRCEFTCQDNRDDCDGDASNGCETDLLSDMEHCGACNNACDPGGACVDGECLPDTEVPNWPLPPESPVDYTVSEDEISVTDNVTGLVWERTPLISSPINWEDARLHCNRLTLEGKQWRLPTAAELLTIVDSTRKSPAINISDLKGTGSGARYWTATTMATSETSAWYVDFTNGASGTATKTTAYNVRCVRGGKNVRGERFTVTGNGKIVLDNKTGLEWEREPIGSTMTWANAQSPCTALGAGWRLPTKKELESLVDRRRGSPMLDTDVFPNVKATNYWTSTVENGRETYAWRVSFQNGTSGVLSKTSSANVICVNKP